MYTENEILIYIILSGISGLVIGYFICYITYKNKSSSKLEDELTKTRREIANQKRILSEFFSGASNLFEQLDSSFYNYAKYMNQHSEKIFPSTSFQFHTSDKKINRETGNSHNDKDKDNETAPLDKKS
ncbi:MAG: ZapG family protein [Succinivibrionaceae bacterium]